jgi:SAM-dependent methyltransferase
VTWRQIVFDTLYRLGRPIWDVAVPEEIHAIAEGQEALPPGKVLDLGCGTSGNVAYLARHGWDATGVDFSAAAIKKARENAGDLAGVTFVLGDVTKLTEQGITGPFDLVIDNGCYHSLPDTGKPAYIREVAAVTKPGAPLLMWEGIRLKPDEIPQRFGADFDVELVTDKDFVGKRFGRQFNIDAHWYQLRRKR